MIIKSEEALRMNIQKMIEIKKDYGISNIMIAQMSGVPQGTVQKIFSGETKSPRYDTVQALSETFEKILAGEVQESASAYVAASNASSNIPKKDYENKTLEDYMALPEGTRIELIDGRFYDMAAPTTIHQKIGLELGHLFEGYIEANGGECVPFVAPTDVQLDCDDKTMVQPDVLVVCDRKKITRARIVGAPDLIVEVLSPSNAMVDLIIKLAKYKHAGVREYWTVFPDDKAVFVYDFTKTDEAVQYSFEDTIPVGIWDGKCKIDFKKIYKKMEFMYQ
jgi:Uma2 family endonuclease